MLGIPGVIVYAFNDSGGYVTMFTVSKTLLMLSATVMVHAGEPFG